MEKRNYGIDLLRLVTMYFIVIIHVLDLGMNLESITTIDSKVIILYLMKTITYCAVNCYALISGFVYYSDDRQALKLKNYVKLWFQAIFYSVIITLYFIIFNKVHIEKKQLLMCMFPASSYEWWYFSAYTALFFIIPFLNKLIKSMDKRDAIKLGVLIILMSFINMLTYFWGDKDAFGLNHGLSFLWLAILYILGGIIKKFKIYNKISTKKCIIVIAISILLAWSSKSIISKISIEISGMVKGSNILMMYTAPTMIGIGICVFIIFVKFKINEKFYKIIEKLSLSSLAVYLIHMHPLIISQILENRYIFLFSCSAFEMIARLFVYALIIFSVCIFIDQIRILIFKILKINKISEKIEFFIRNIFCFIENKMFNIE